jgi:hypothetical protein
MSDFAVLCSLKCRSLPNRTSSQRPERAGHRPQLRGMVGDCLPHARVHGVRVWVTAEGCAHSPAAVVKGFSAISHLGFGPSCLR